jgi:hypothetical protein
MRGVESLLHVLPQVSSSSSLHGAADEMAAAALTSTPPFVCLLPPF